MKWFVGWITGVGAVVRAGGRRRWQGCHVSGVAGHYWSGLIVFKALSSEDWGPPLWMERAVWETAHDSLQQRVIKTRVCIWGWCFFTDGGLQTDRKNCSSSFITVSKCYLFFKYCVIRLMDFQIFPGHRDNGTVLSIGRWKFKLCHIW